ncbi:hypothetical protein Pelo_19741 [Pelomyxa schiedti]|nr:hypothetical protein Pelo_19741 [Pelomyxa schiedti]
MYFSMTPLAQLLLILPPHFLTGLDNVVVSSAAATKSAPTSAPPTSASATATSTDTASASSATTTTTAAAAAAASPPPPPDCRGFLKIRAVFIPAHPVNPSASVCQWEVSVLTADMHNSGTIDELATVQLVGSSAGEIPQKVGEYSHVTLVL